MLELLILGALLLAASGKKPLAVLPPAMPRTDTAPPAPLADGGEFNYSNTPGIFYNQTPDSAIVTTASSSQPVAPTPLSGPGSPGYAAAMQANALSIQQQSQAASLSNAAKAASASAAATAAQIAASPK